MTVRMASVIPRIESATASLLRMRLDRPIGGSGVKHVDVIVVDLRAEGLCGLGFSYALACDGGPAAAIAAALCETLVGMSNFHPAAVWRGLACGFNRTGRGQNYVALAAVDVALWDLYARAQGVALGLALGGAPREVPVYASGDFNDRQSAEDILQRVHHNRERGYLASKPRVNGSVATASLIERVASDLPSDTALMLDANEKCTATSANRLLAAARAARVLFVEEPLRAHDLSGHRALRAAGFAGLVATGEHAQGCEDLLPIVAERLSSVIQPDLAMFGGITEIKRIADIAAAFGVEVSPHFLPDLFVHLAAACPNVTWLEDFPLLEPLFTPEGAVPARPVMTLPPRPGHGLQLTDDTRKRYAL